MGVRFSSGFSAPCVWAETRLIPHLDMVLGHMTTTILLTSLLNSIDLTESSRIDSVLGVGGGGLFDFFGVDDEGVVDRSIGMNTGSAAGSSFIRSGKKGRAWKLWRIWLLRVCGSVIGDGLSVFAIDCHRRGTNATSALFRASTVTLARCARFCTISVTFLLSRAKSYVIPCPYKATSNQEDGWWSGGSGWVEMVVGSKFFAIFLFLGFATLGNDGSGVKDRFPIINPSGVTSWIVEGFPGVGIGGIACTLIGDVMEVTVVVFSTGEGEECR
ncbi:hypothetical protein A4A49_08010 [Nicotiana attenuata]|uniref:Uncharacterized protein n=1 Tax=Nicotiana attenuata TaxID=49451 RepID=A0A314KT21_NICAT|nr:hypothetical protein A4A49_08010 [Nicotiana attenuata]